VEPSIIYGIEEPETSQHPNHQRMIIDALCELSKQENVQVLFTTHSANLVREIPIESLRYISYNENNELTIEYGKNFDNSSNEIVIGKIINTLGILPNPADRIRVLVYVEGNHDVNALKRYSQILHAEDGEVINLSATYEVGYVITGGSALKHYIEQKHLEGLGKPEVHIYDRDVDDYRRIVSEINAANNPNKVAFNTTKNELENYLHNEAISDGYAKNGLRVEIGPIDDTMDVPAVIAKTLNENWDTLQEDKKEKLASEKKRFLNTVAVEAMTIERIRARDGYDEMRNWLTTIKRFL